MVGCVWVARGAAECSGLQPGDPKTLNTLAVLAS